MFPLLPLLALLAPQDVRDAVPVDRTGRLSDAVRESLAGVDPALGGWAGEVLLERIGPRLDELRAALADGAPLADLATADVSLSGAAALELSDVRTAPPLRVARAGRAAPPEPGAPGALAERLAALADLAGPAPRHAKLKVVATMPDRELEAPAGGAEAADPGPISGATRLRLELSSPGVQVVAELEARWTADDPPRLAALAILDVEQVRHARPQPLFADVTEAVLGGEAFDRVLRQGLEHWRARLDTALGVGTLGHHGIALGDVDGDGLEDLYACQPGGLPNLLFLHAADGTAREVGRAANVDLLDPSASVLLLDLDGDVDLDLVVSVAEELALFANDGAGHFTPRVKLPAPGVTSLAAADVDRDGTVDLFACCYLSPYDGRGTPLPYHDARNGAANRLFLNRGAFVFDDGSDASGLTAAPPRFSFAASFEDFDLDGDQDLYVANDFGRNELWRNDGTGHFVDAAEELSVQDLSAGMGVSWGDYDGDGWPDLYVSNMYSSAGNRVAYGRRFRPGASEDEREDFRRHARGNTLFRNVEGRVFHDVTDEAHVGMGRWAWGSLFVELDNDGAPDLVVPNGFVTQERSDDL